MKSIFKVVIAATILCLFTVNAWALNPNQERNENGQIVETFYIYSDTDLLSISASPEQFLKPMPVSVQFLFEPNLFGGLAVLSKMRNSFNEVVGFTSELEHITTDTNGITTSLSDWTFKIPGRGMLAVTQIEDFTSLIAIIMDMVAKGEMERYMDPPFVVTTTIPGSGKIIGGVGEFEGKTGTFKEINEIYYLSLATGSIGVNITLEVTYDDNEDEQ